MNKVNDYTQKINRFGRSMEKMLQEDFPGNQGVVDKLDDFLAAIQFNILGAFMEKGNK